MVSTDARHLRQLLRMALGQEEIGRRIKEAREDLSLSQRELAERIGLADAQSISRYERGETEVPAKRLRRIAEATGKDMSFFVMEIRGEAIPASDLQALREAMEHVETAVDEILRLLRRFLPEADSTSSSGPAESS
jgi:transcriptional regulator with XRE-family HTH domain